jgi:hypothetical protein
MANTRVAGYLVCSRRCPSGSATLCGLRQVGRLVDATDAKRESGPPQDFSDQKRRAPHEAHAADRRLDIEWDL